MRVIQHSNELQSGGRRVCAAIGVFDGLHLGHQQVIRRTLVDAHQFGAISVVITFDRHPSAVVAPGRVPPMLYTKAQKLRTLEQLGVDVVLMIPFDEAFSRLGGEQFIRQLVADFAGLRSLSVGADFAFGHKRSGNVPLLQRLGAELGFQVHGLAAVALDGETVSSTRIRQAILAGRLEEANQMLGRSWSLVGKVVRGDQLGRTIGFPTANLDVSGAVLPPAGVYAAHAIAGGVPRRAVMNIGFRPTVASATPSLRVEVHILDFEGDLYDQEVEVFFVGKLRDEKKFDSVAALRSQIEIDIRAASQLFD